MTSPPPEPQSLSFEDAVVHFRSAGPVSWQVPLSAIRVIGEYTNESGPMGDDWFVVFVQSDGKWYEVPTDAPNVAAVLTAIGKELGEPLSVSLANSTSFQSRVLWPSALREQPLLSFRKVPHQNWIFWAIGVKNVCLELTEEVQHAARTR